KWPDTENALEHGTYRNQFQCVRKSVPIVPTATAMPPSAIALGPQIALVVGLPETPVTTERDHQIKIQFPWQRGINPNVGGLSDINSIADKVGNAPGNADSGTWVRVAEALAGPNWGTHFVPRIGFEVLVDFIEGDMDRPVIVSALYNGADIPPFSAGIDSGVNHAGLISGVHSQNLGGDGFNQWVIDDTQTQLRMRLASSTAASQLNIGYLISQAPSSAQRGSYRGLGFELRSDAWSILRGAQGVLLSTTARAGQGSSVASTQMDVRESVAQLKAAESLTKTMSEAATHQQAWNSPLTKQAHSDYIKAIDQQQDGKYTAPVNGQPALITAPGSRSLTEPVDRFAKSVVHFDTPTTSHWASPASSVFFAGQQLHWTTQGDLHMSAAHTYSSVSGNTTTFFSHAGGIQIYAGNGPVSLQSHTDQLEILADKEITVISVHQHIKINAQKKITLMAGQSSITLEGGNITFACPAHFTVKGALHPFDVANSVPANLKSLPDSKAQVLPHDAPVDAAANGIPSVPVTGHRLTQQEREDVDTLTRETRGHNLIAEQLEPGYVQTQALLEKKFPRTAAWTRQQISQGVPAKDAVDSVAKLYGVTGAKGVVYNPAEAAIARSRGEHVVAGGDGKYYYQPSPDKDVDLKIQQNWNKDRANLIGEYAGKNRITNEDVAFNASPIGAVGAATAAVVGKRATAVINVANGKELLQTEGNVGTYEELIAAGSKGDNITPHHIPSANKMALNGARKEDGIAMNMEQPSPGAGGRHRETFPYGTKADVKMSPRDALAAGVRDARRIYQKDGLYGSQIRSSLQELINQNKTTFQSIFTKQ
ncbi:MAG: type VI secretion system tip protein VgrG, partial [Burkholderiales bacterium]|nr:type VI secretion system tip protein VgrG [Burkholderiales bacterium]